MKEQLKIIVESRFVNPHLGGAVQTTIREYNMENGNDAELYYLEELEHAKKSGGNLGVTISIVTKK